MTGEHSRELLNYLRLNMIQIKCVLYPKDGNDKLVMLTRRSVESKDLLSMKISKTLYPITILRKGYKVNRN